VAATLCTSPSFRAQSRPADFDPSALLTSGREGITHRPLMRVRRFATTWRMYTRRMGADTRHRFEPDPVIEVYKRDVDRTLLREHLRLTPQQRIEKLMSFMRSLDRLRQATRKTR
jgi:hypothetical protein